MDRLMTNSRLGLNHHIQDELNIDNNLTTNSGFGLNHHIDHQELSTYINPTANNSGFGLNHHHIKEVSTYKLTANSGFVHNHYVWEHNTNRLTVNSELDLKHYAQEDNVKAQKKKVSMRIDSSGRLPLPPTFQNPNKKTTYEFKNKKKTADKDDNGNNTTQTFTFRELASATKNFRQEYLLGAGGFGNVFKGRLQNSGQLVAIKQLDRNGLQGNREFLAEAVFLGLLRHQNLVNLIGYCADGDQRLLVYEYMPLGTLEDHLLDLAPDQKPLDWYTRMKIAAGVAKGLAYLHDNTNPPVIHRDLKSSNILLDEGFNPKLSDFGLAKLGPIEDKTQLLSQVAGTYGYCAPDYARTGKLSVKLDIYSFGVVLLELITGRRAIDTSRPTKEQNLVYWARPLFKDRKKFPSMADPLLQGDFPTKSLYQALAVAAMCIQDEATLRPLISSVVNALSFIVLSLSSPDKISSDNNGKQDERQKTIAEAGGFDSNSSKGNNRRSCWVWCK